MIRQTNATFRRRTAPELHLSVFGGMQFLCEKLPHSDVSRRFGHTRHVTVVAPHDETCGKCLTERDKLRERGIGAMLVGIMIT